MIWIKLLHCNKDSLASMCVVVLALVLLEDLTDMGKTWLNQFHHQGHMVYLLIFLGSLWWISNQHQQHRLSHHRVGGRRFQRNTRYHLNAQELDRVYLDVRSLEPLEGQLNSVVEPMAHQQLGEPELCMVVFQLVDQLGFFLVLEVPIRKILVALGKELEQYMAYLVDMYSFSPCLRS